MINNTEVLKRNGSSEQLDVNKVHKVLTWAAEGLNKVSVSQVEMGAHIQFFNGIPTKDIHRTLIKSAADLISAETPDYDKLSARLLMFQIRKKAYGTFEPPPFYTHIKGMVSKGLYDKSILEFYDEGELQRAGTFIVHSRDMDLRYAGAKQLEGKYLVQNRTTGEIFESPQFLYMMIALCLFSSYDKKVRWRYVLDFYNAISTRKVSLPTPIMAGVRTTTRQFSSCVLIEAGDSLDEINATSAAIIKYVSQKAGIGVNAGMIRAKGSAIRNGDTAHTGVIPFYKHFQTAVKSCSQGGLRGGSATLFYPLWHSEVESLLVLKNNRGVEENRVRHLDYGVQFNGFLYSKLIEGGDIYLFSPSDVEGLYDAFFQDQALFAELYNKYAADDSVRKTKVSAVSLFSLFAQERAGTGRIYLQNVDHCNTNSPFLADVAPIKQSNLCLEIALPTKPLKHVFDEEGEVALCTLAAINLGEVSDLGELDGLGDLLVRALDNLLDYQDYPLPAAKRSTMDRRPLGVGLVGYAHWLAKNKVKYSDGSANNLTHEMMEAFQFALIKASNLLAKEKGACPKYHETTWSKGVLPQDRCKSFINTVHSAELKQDWASLRGSITLYGMRNSTVSSLMPSETSSQVLNATNGIEPPRGLVSVKASKDGVLKQVVPDYEELKDYYELLWDQPSCNGYLELVGIMQKWICQSASANTNYDPSKFEDGKVPVKLILQDMLKAYKLGVKTLYYHNTRDGADDGQEDIVEEDDGCAGGACKI